MITTLDIKQLLLNVNLGWREKERDSEQAIYLDMIIRFFEPPKACVTDELDDTQCYATLINHIREHLNDKHFKLVEHLAAEIYHLTKSILPQKTEAQIAITKFPKVGGLTGGVTFHYGDF